MHVGGDADAACCLPSSLPSPLQGPLFAPNYYLSMDGFRALTSQRVAAFVGQRFFSTFDYVRDPLKFQAS